MRVDFYIPWNTGIITYLDLSCNPTSPWESNEYTNEHSNLLKLSRISMAARIISSASTILEYTLKIQWNTSLRLRQLLLIDYPSKRLLIFSLCITREVQKDPRGPLFIFLLLYLKFTTCVEKLCNFPIIASRERNKRDIKMQGCKNIKKIVKLNFLPLLHNSNNSDTAHSSIVKKWSE